MATQSIYEVLTEKVKVFPEDGESEQDFLIRLKKAVDEVPEEEFYELPEEVQVWANDAVTAVEHKQPIQMCPGSPFKNGEDATETEPTPPRRAGGKKPAAKPAAEPAGKRGRKPATKEAAAKKTTKKAAKPPAEPDFVAPKPAKTKRVKEKKEKKIGVLELLLKATLADPRATPAELKSRVEAANPGMECKIANAIGIRQQFRRIVYFLQGQKVDVHKISFE